MTDTKYVEIGGAKSSDFAPRYDQIPASALRRIAQRFSKGNKKFDDVEAAVIGGRMNWQYGDGSFFRERFNHILEHLMAWKEQFEFPQIDGIVSVDKDEDDLAAAAWGCIVLMWAEDNCNLTEPPNVPLPDTSGLKLPDAQEIQGQHVENATDKVLSFFGLK